MRTPHPHPWHRGSVFGDGPRRPLDRGQRARYRFLLNAHRRAGRLTLTAVLVGDALVRRLGVDGQLDPAHETIAADVGCCSRTVRRALAALKAVGLVMWQCRLVRDGWRCAQASNAYLLVFAGVGPLPAFPAPHCGGQNVRETRRKSSFPSMQLESAVPEVSTRAQQDAVKGLAAIAAARRQKLSLG